jgi:hypothetical protein
MLSESTARLVEHTVTLAEPELVCVKGAGEPVCAHRMMALPGMKRPSQSFVKQNSWYVSCPLTRSS